MYLRFFAGIIALLCAALSTVVCYSQNTYNSIAELQAANLSSGAIITLETNLSVVATGVSYLLIADDNNDLILLSYWKGVDANDFTIGSRFKKYSGYYTKLSDNNPCFLGYSAASSGIADEDWIAAVHESSLPQPTDITDSDLPLNTSMIYIKLRGSVNFDNIGKIYQISYQGKKCPLNGFEFEQDGVYDIVGYIGSNDLTIYAYSKYPEASQAAKVNVSVKCEPKYGGKAWIGDDEGTTSVEATADESIILHAGANAGYNFVGWEKDGSMVNTETDYSLTVEGAAEYTACFEAVASKRTLSVRAGEGGTAKIEGTEDMSAEYDDGTAVTVTAEPDDGYDFTGWGDGTDIVSTQNPYTFNITENISLTPNFSRKPASTCTLAEYLAAASPSGEYTLSGNYTVVATARLIIFISDGENTLKCEFRGAGAEVSEACPAGTIVSGVTFKPINDDGKTYALLSAVPTVVSSGGSGTVPFVSTDLAGAIEKTGKYVEIANVMISKVESTYYMYVQKPSYKECIIETDKFKTENEPTSSDRWTVRGVMDYFKTGTGWQQCLYANLVEKSSEVPVTYTLTLKSGEGGSVWIGEDKTQKMGNFAEGAEVTINAEAKEGYTFKEWSAGEASIGTDNPMTYTVTGNAEITAVFEKNAPVNPPAGTRKITISSANPAKGSVKADEFEGLEAETDKSVTIRAIPATENDFFTKWHDGEHYSTANPYVYDGADDLTLTAYFVSRYKVNFAAPNNATMSVMLGDGTTLHSGDRVDEGDEIVVVVTPASGYVVETITANGTAVGHTSSAVRLTVNGEMTIAATVMPEVIGEIQLSVVSSDAQMGKAYINTPGTTSVTLRRGVSAVCHAEPAEGCRFDGWREVGTTVIKSCESVYTLGFQSGDVHLEAVFSYIVQTPFTVTVKSSNPAKGRVSIKGESGASVTTRSAVTVVATPAKEYDYFVDWTDEHSVVLSDKAEYTYTATQSVTLTANFRSHYPVTFSAEGNGTLSVADETGASMESGTVRDEGGRISVSAEAAEHHFVESVSINGADVTEAFLQSDSRYSTAIAGPTDIKVVFSPDMHTVSIEDTPHGVVSVYRGVDPDGAGVGSALSDGDRAPYGTILYILAFPEQGYTLSGVLVNGTLRQPESGAAHIVHKVEGDVSIKPVYSAVSGIGAILPEGAEIEAVYNLRGLYLGKQLPDTPGIYIIRTGGRTLKIAITAH